MLAVPATPLTAPAPPPVPADAADDRALAIYVAGLAQAGEVCRQQLAAVARIVRAERHAP